MTIVQAAGGDLTTLTCGGRCCQSVLRAHSIGSNSFVAGWRSTSGNPPCSFASLLRSHGHTRTRGSPLRAPVGHTSALIAIPPICSGHIDRGVSDLSAFRTSACARRSRFRQRAKPGHGHLGAHLRPLGCSSGRTIWATIKRWRPFGKTAKLPHGQRVYRRAA
jgi:hypothetical protein